MDKTEKGTGTPGGGQPTRVTPGVPPAVGPDTETVRKLNETVRADEPSNGGDQANDQAGEVKDQAQQNGDGVKGQAQEKVKQIKQAAPDQINQVASTVQAQARQNPLPFAMAGALLAGFAIGRASKKS